MSDHDALTGVLRDHAWSAAFGGCPDPCGWQSTEGVNEQAEHAWHVADELLASDAYRDLIAAAEQRGAARALREAADDWGGIEGPGDSADTDDWLRDRADRIARGDL